MSIYTKRRVRRPFACYIRQKPVTVRQAAIAEVEVREGLKSRGDIPKFELEKLRENSEVLTARRRHWGRVKISMWSDQALSIAETFISTSETIRADLSNAPSRNGALKVAGRNIFRPRPFSTFLQTAITCVEAQSERNVNIGLTG